MVLQVVRIASGLIALLVAAVLPAERYGRFVLILTIAQIGLVLLNGVSITVSQDARAGTKMRESAAVRVFVAVSVAWCLVQAGASWWIHDGGALVAFIAASVATFVLPAALLVVAARLRARESNVDAFLFRTEVWPGAASLLAVLAVVLASTADSIDPTETQVLVARLLPFPLIVAVVVVSIRRLEWRRTAPTEGTATRSLLSAAAYGATTLESRLDLFICAAIASPELVGVYAFYKRMNDMVALPTVIQTQRAIARLAADDVDDVTALSIGPAQARDLTNDSRQAVTETALLGVGAVAGLGVAAVLGILESYTPYWPLIVVMAIGGLVNAATGPTSPLLMTSGRERTQIVLSVSGVLAVGISGIVLSQLATSTEVRWLVVLAVTVAIVGAVRSIGTARLLSRQGSPPLGMLGWMAQR